MSPSNGALYDLTVRANLSPEQHSFFWLLICIQPSVQHDGYHLLVTLYMLSTWLNVPGASLS